MKRTTLVLDPVLLNQATRVLGVKTYSAAVNLALAEILRVRKIQNLPQFFGRGLWQGDLGEMRVDSIAARRPLKLRFLAAGRSGHPDTAKRAEELLWGDRTPRSSNSRKRTGRGRKQPSLRAKWQALIGRVSAPISLP